MPALSYVTITGTFDDGSGSPLSGAVTFTPNTTVYAAGIPVLQPGVPVEAQIVAGELFGPSGGPLTLLATDNSGLSYEGNTGFFFWSVQVVISGQTLGPWEFFLPHEPSTVDLWSLANTVPGAAGILPPAGDIGGTTTDPVVARIQGTVIEAPPGGTTEYLRGDGTWDVPPGAVSSVFGRAGAVAAESGDYTAAEVGADPSGSAASAQAAAESYAASQASAALSSAETFTTSVVAAETARAETAEALLAPKASPAFTGSPTAPTASPLTDSTQVATTAYTDAAVAAETSRAETAEALKAPLASPVLTGSPTAPTATTGDTSARIATDQFVATAVATETSRAEAAEALLAPLASPAFTGSPTAPTKPALTDNTDVATTAYTDSAVAAETSRAEAAEALKAPLASPALTGAPTAPTQTSGDSSAKIATDAFVATAVAAETTRAETAEAAAQANAEAASLPLPSGTAANGSVPVATGTGEASRWGAGGGVTVLVPAPTGATATDTPNVTAAISSLVTALASAPATLLFQDGVYQVDSNSLVIRSPNTTTVASGSNGAEPATWVAGATGTLTVTSSTSAFPSSGQLWLACSGNTVALVAYTGTSGSTFTGCTYLSGSPSGTLSAGNAVTGCLSNFTVRGSGGTVIAQAPNRSALPNNVTGNIFTVADCTDFRVETLTLDGKRDTVSPMTPLTASAASGQPSVTVAAGAGANYQAGQYLCVSGGLGTSDQLLAEGTSVGAGTPKVIASITPGGGSGGGDLITFTANLANTYTVTGTTPYTDGFGPYAYNGAFVTCYQTGYDNSVAGRTLSGEDQQCGIHIINCQRFVLSRLTGRNLWESPVKIGTGESPASLITDSCSHGLVDGCTGTHCYDQGVSVWNSTQITVTGCLENATGWTGISLTGSDNCTVTGNQVMNTVYRWVAEDAGHGITVEGGVGNQVHGNVITGGWGSGIRLIISPVKFGLPGGSGNPYLTAFLEAGTVAGTSIAVSATSALMTGGKYSFDDGYQSEAITVASIIDGTHVTIAEDVQFSHNATTTYIGPRIAQDNSVIGNTIRNVSYAQPGGTGAHSDGNGLDILAAVRNLVHGNKISRVGGSGIYMGSGTTESGGSTVQGDGTVVSQNSVRDIYGTSSGAAIYAVGSTRIQVLDNDVSNAAEVGGIKLLGVLDSRIAGNTVHDLWNAAGINTGPNSGTNCSRLIITENHLYRISQQGLALNLADSCVITGNRIWGCGTGDAGLTLYGCTNCIVEANTSNSNSIAGIKLANSSSTGCTNCRVINNTCRNDASGTGANVATNGNYSQQTGILESGNSDYNVYEANELDGNTSAQLTLAGTHSAARRNIISGSLLPPSVSTPSVPSSTTAQQNATGHDVFAYIAGGTVTAITVGSTATGITTGMVFVPAGQTITLTYSAAPTWTWIAAG
jgi:parallel beta-helix repeat protein